MMIAFVIAATTIVSLASPLLPDDKLTPGAVRPGVTVEEVCGAPSPTGSVDEAIMVMICQEYGEDNDCPGPAWEIDHLIPRELGGSNAPANLWPQPISEARMKHRLEKRLHREVCGGSLDLWEAQRCIATDWVACYQTHLRRHRR